MVVKKWPAFDSNITESGPTGSGGGWGGRVGEVTGLVQSSSGKTGAPC